MWLSFEGVSLGYGAGPDVLSLVDLRVGPGIWALVGPNGSGKTSLLRASAGLMRPRQGRITWDGADIAAAPARHRWRLGYVPQETEEYPDLHAAEYLAYLAALKGIRPEFQAARAAEALRLMNLEAGRPREYSAGMRRRLAVAAALLNDPDLLLLDEPTVGLDLQEVLHLRTLLTELAADRVVLLATHVPEEWAGVVDGWIQVRHKGAYLDADADRITDQDLSGRSDRPG